MHHQSVLVAVAVTVDRRVGARAADERVVGRDRPVGIEVQHLAVNRAVLKQHRTADYRVESTCRSVGIGRRLIQRVAGETQILAYRKCAL